MTVFEFVETRLRPIAGYRIVQQRRWIQVVIGQCFRQVSIRRVEEEDTNDIITR